MRAPLFALLTLSTALSAALAAEPARPVNVPPPPPPPPAGADEEQVEPTITIIQREDATVSEYRLAGKLYMIKVKPKVGPEYALYDEKGDGQMVRQDAHTQLRPPMWVIKRF